MRPVASLSALLFMQSLWRLFRSLPSLSNRKERVDWGQNFLGKHSGKKKTEKGRVAEKTMENDGRKVLALRQWWMTTQSHFRKFHFNFNFCFFFLVISSCGVFVLRFNVYFKLPQIKWTELQDGASFPFMDLLLFPFLDFLRKYFLFLSLIWLFISDIYQLGLAFSSVIFTVTERKLKAVSEEEVACVFTHHTYKKTTCFLKVFSGNRNKKTPYISYGFCCFLKAKTNEK